MKSRPYQAEAVNAIFEEWKEATSTLLVLPTGTGKTIVFAKVIARAFPRRALVIAHREELIFQAADKIGRVTGLQTAIEMANYRADKLDAGLFAGPNVIVSTVQTLTAGGDGAGRMTKFLPTDFDFLIVDEAHHGTASTYRRVLDYFKQNPKLKILGVTATPDRADEMALGKVYDTVAYDYEIADAIHDGWLVPITQQMVNVEGLDLSSVRTTAGDLNGADLAAVLEDEANLHAVAGPAIEIAGQRRMLVFAASVAQAERLAEIFNRSRPGCASHVSGATPKEDRRQILADFAAGRIRIVVNCAVLTEGFDDPGVEVVVMARPTKSRALYAQMIGRATRPLPGIVDDAEDTADHRIAAIAASPKPSCLIVDFVGNCGRHKLVTAADILGGDYSDDEIAELKTRVAGAGKPFRPEEELAAIRAEREARRLRDAAQRAKLVAKATYTIQGVSPFDILGIDVPAERGWHQGKALSKPQRDILIKNGLEPDRMTYAQGKAMLNEIFARWNGNLCSFKQAKILQKFGYDTRMPFAEAKTTIDKIAAAGWRRTSP